MGGLRDVDAGLGYIVKDVVVGSFVPLGHGASLEKGHCG